MRRCKADQEQKCQKWAATPDAYRAVSRLRMAARRALEQIGMRYEISDLLNSSVRKCFLKATGKSWGLLQIEELQAVYVYVGRGLECFKGATAPIAPMLPPPMWESTSECLYSFGDCQDSLAIGFSFGSNWVHWKNLNKWRRTIKSQHCLTCAVDSISLKTSITGTLKATKRVIAGSVHMAVVHLNHTFINIYKK